MSGTHKCYVTKCTERVRVELLMCSTHWGMVPRPLQRDVYRTRQQLDKFVADGEHAGHGAYENARLQYLNAIRAARAAAEAALPSGPHAA